MPAAIRMIQTGFPELHTQCWKQGCKYSQALRAVCCTALEMATLGNCEQPTMQHAWISTGVPWEAGQERGKEHNVLKKCLPNKLYRNMKVVKLNCRLYVEHKVMESSLSGRLLLPTYFSRMSFWSPCAKSKRFASDSSDIRNSAPRIKREPLTKSQISQVFSPRLVICLTKLEGGGGGERRPFKNHPVLSTSSVCFSLKAWIGKHLLAYANTHRT